MNLLLDTHVYLWFLADSPKLPRSAKARIDEAQEVAVSAASIWEASIKAALGKLMVDPEALIEGIAASGFVELPVMARHAARVYDLPRRHQDPFDRLLIAQAMEGPFILMTADDMLTQYTDLVQLISISRV